MAKSRQINLPVGEKLYEAVTEYAAKNRRYVTTLFWTALAAQHPELAKAIEEDRLR